MSKMYKQFNALRVAGLRQCTVCLGQKPDSEFAKNISKHKNTGLCRLCKRTRDKADYYKHREKRLAYWKTHKEKYPGRLQKINRVAVSKHRFGLDRDELIKETSVCEYCHITQKEHREEYKGLSLNIHHKDGWGRKALRLGEPPNNEPDNLMILCHSCHTKEHNTKRINREYKTEMYKKIWATRRGRGV